MVKKEIRKAALQRRRFIQNRDLKERKITAKIIELSKPYKSIGIYMSMDDEVATKDIIRILKEEGKKVYVPTTYDDYIEFHEYIDDDHLAKGKYDILESTGPIAKEMELLIIPLVAFDEKLHRLGMGKGYYDRYLKDFKGLKVGLAYEEQREESIACEEHDVAMDVIVSEKGIYR